MGSEQEGMWLPCVILKMWKWKHAEPVFHAWLSLVLVIIIIFLLLLLVRPLFQTPTAGCVSLFICVCVGYAEAQLRQYQRLTKQIKPDMDNYERQREEWWDFIYSHSTSEIMHTLLKLVVIQDSRLQDFNTEITMWLSAIVQNVKKWKRKKSPYNLFTIFQFLCLLVTRHLYQWICLYWHHIWCGTSSLKAVVEVKSNEY